MQGKFNNEEEVEGDRGVEVDASGVGDVGCLEENSRCRRKDRLLLRFFQSKMFGN